MKNLLTLLLLFISSILLSQGFTINNFDVSLEIKADGSYYITETIDVNFYEKRRGIFRDIETTYIIDNKRVNLDISNIQVLNHDYKVTEGKNKINIRIGNPDIYLIGDQVYTISYIIRNGIISLPDHQEFHFDLIGNDIQTVTESVQYEIKLPRGITLQPEDYKVTGGKKGQNLNVAELSQINPTTLSGRSLRPLKNGEGITAAIRFPSRYLAVASNTVEFYESQNAKNAKDHQPWYLAIPAVFFWFLHILLEKNASKRL